MIKKIIFITNLYSPFQVELAHDINSISPYEYHVGFAAPFSKKRGRHWYNDTNSENIWVAETALTIDQKIKWITNLIKRVKPDLVLSGFLKGPISEAIKKCVKQMNLKIGLWLEPPRILYNPLMKWIYINFLLKNYLYNIDFILAIGDRAESIYGNVIGKDKVFFVPYAQDLSQPIRIERSRKSEYENEKIVFLFSGQLIKRHNIELIAKAIVKLYKKHPDNFSFVIAGYGPEETNFRNIIKNYPGLNHCISYDRDYEKWEDRLIPFSYSDVFVYPSNHSGWGLVVPEAMASGMLVITTSNVESARYLIVNNKNGFFIKPNIDDLVKKMEWCIQEKEKIFEIGKEARIVSEKSSSSYVAKLFSDSISNIVSTWSDR